MVKSIPDQDTSGSARRFRCFYLQRHTKKLAQVFVDFAVIQPAPFVRLLSPSDRPVMVQTTPHAALPASHVCELAAGCGIWSVFIQSACQCYAGRFLNSIGIRGGHNRWRLTTFLLLLDPQYACLSDYLTSKANIVSKAEQTVKIKYSYTAAVLAGIFLSVQAATDPRVAIIDSQCQKIYETSDNQYRIMAGANLSNCASELKRCNSGWGAGFLHPQDEKAVHYRDISWQARRLHCCRCALGLFCLRWLPPSRRDAASRLFELRGAVSHDEQVPSLYKQLPPCRGRATGWKLSI